MRVAFESASAYTYLVVKQDAQCYFAVQSHLNNHLIHTAPYVNGLGQLLAPE